MSIAQSIVEGCARSPGNHRGLPYNVMIFTGASGLIVGVGPCASSLVDSSRASSLSLLNGMRGDSRNSLEYSLMRLMPKGEGCHGR